MAVLSACSTVQIGADVSCRIIAGLTKIGQHGSQPQHIRPRKLTTSFCAYHRPSALLVPQLATLRSGQANILESTSAALENGKEIYEKEVRWTQMTRRLWCVLVHA